MEDLICFGYNSDNGCWPFLDTITVKEYLDSNKYIPDYMVDEWRDGKNTTYGSGNVVLLSYSEI